MEAHGIGASGNEMLRQMVPLAALDNCQKTSYEKGKKNKQKPATAPRKRKPIASQRPETNHWAHSSSSGERTDGGGTAADEKNGKTICRQRAAEESAIDRAACGPKVDPRPQPRGAGARSRKRTPHRSAASPLSPAPILAAGDGCAHARSPFGPS